MDTLNSREWDNELLEGQEPGPTWPATIGGPSDASMWLNLRASAANAEDPRRVGGSWLGLLVQIFGCEQNVDLESSDESPMNGMLIRYDSIFRKTHPMTLQVALRTLQYGWIWI